MVPTTRTFRWDRFNGSETFGGNASVPTYFDDEVKAIDLSGCSISSTGETKDQQLKHVLYDAATNITVNLHVDQVYKFWQIFTGAKSVSSVDAVVLEPLSSMSDAYNNHDSLHVISADETLTSAYAVSLD